ncbi:MAG: hypothetical protein AAB252_00615 [Pseudomonadota bacterium]
MAAEQKSPDMKMDPASLCREDIFTDRKMGTIRRLVPIKADGTDDSSRPMTYIGEAQLMTPMGTLPINFPIEAKSLEEAVAKYGVTAKAAVDRTMKELTEMRRQAASSLVIPQPGTGIGPGGLPGGGKIQIP